MAVNKDDLSPEYLFISFLKGIFKYKNNGFQRVKTRKITSKFNKFENGYFNNSQQTRPDL